MAVTWRLHGGCTPLQADAARRRAALSADVCINATSAARASESLADAKEAMLEDAGAPANLDRYTSSLVYDADVSTRELGTPRPHTCPTLTRPHVLLLWE